MYKDEYSDPGNNPESAGPFPGSRWRPASFVAHLFGYCQKNGVFAASRDVNPLWHIFIVSRFIDRSCAAATN